MTRIQRSSCCNSKATQPKPLVRVTQIEAFRRWMYQSEHDAYEISEQSVIDSITKDFTGNEFTRIGTAFHSIVETGSPVCDKVPAGVRKFTYYGKPSEEPVPCGRRFSIDGHDVILDVPQCKVALSYRDDYPGAFHEVRTLKDFGEAVITGCADMIDGMELRDIKTKFSVPVDSAYISSCQWRYYMELFGADTFHFDLFCFDGYNKDKHGYDVRGLPLTRREPITVYRYPGMEQDNANLLHDFIEWAGDRHLLSFLTKDSI